MDITLRKDIIENLDLTAAALFGIADAKKLWPLNVKAFLNEYPYIEARTLRHRLDQLCIKGYLTKTQSRNEANLVIVVYDPI